MFEPTEDWVEKQDLDEYTLSKVRSPQMVDTGQDDSEECALST